MIASKLPAVGTTIFTRMSALANECNALNLSQGLSGIVTCDRDALLLPLVSQSGLERIDLRLWRSARGMLAPDV